MGDTWFSRIFILKDENDIPIEIHTILANGRHEWSQAGEPDFDRHFKIITGRAAITTQGISFEAAGPSILEQFRTRGIVLEYPEVEKAAYDEVVEIEQNRWSYYHQLEQAGEDISYAGPQMNIGNLANDTYSYLNNAQNNGSLPPLSQNGALGAVNNAASVNNGQNNNPTPPVPNGAGTTANNGQNNNPVPGQTQTTVPTGTGSTANNEQENNPTPVLPVVPPIDPLDVEEEEEPEIERRWTKKRILGASLAVASGLGALGAGAYFLNRAGVFDKKKQAQEEKDNQEEQSKQIQKTLNEKYSLNQRKWDYYENNVLPNNDSKKFYVNVDDVTETFNGKETRDGARNGFTAEEAIALKTYVTMLNTPKEDQPKLYDQLMEVYHGEKIGDKDAYITLVNSSLVKYQYFLATDTTGNSGLSLLLDEEQGKLLEEFEKMNAEYNKADNDKDKTKIGIQIKEAYVKYFVDENSKDFKEYTTETNPVAAILGQSHLPLMSVRTRNSSADTKDIYEMFERGTLIRCASNSKQAVESYNDYVEDFNQEYMEEYQNHQTYETRDMTLAALAKAEGEKYTPVELTGEEARHEQRYQELQKRKDYIYYNTIEVETAKKLIDEHMKDLGKEPSALIDIQNAFTDAINENHLLPLRSKTKSSGSGSKSSGSTTGGSSQAKVGTVEVSGKTPQEAAQKALEAGATQEQIDAADQKIKDANVAAEKEAQNHAWKIEAQAQSQYDYIFDNLRYGDMTSREAREWLKENTKFNSDQIDTIIKDGQNAKKADEKAEEEVGGKVTDKGKDDYQDHEEDKEYDRPDVAPGADDLINSTPGENVLDPLPDGVEDTTTNTNNGTNGGTTGDTTTENGNTNASDGGIVMNPDYDGMIQPGTPGEEEEVFDPGKAEEDMNQSTPEAETAQTEVTINPEGLPMNDGGMVAGEEVGTETTVENTMSPEELSAEIDRLLQEEMNASEAVQASEGHQMVKTK